jgi:histidine decarboxylase
MNVRVTPPTQDPNNVYPKVDGIDYHLFQLSGDGTSPENRKEAFKQLLAYETVQRDNFLGYQANQKLDYSDLSEYLNYQLNNLGDPFVEGNFTVNSKFAERAVLDYFASLWNARWPHCNKDQDKDWRESYWGYVTSMGATEGNVYGLWNARDYLAGRFLLVDGESAAKAKEISKDSNRPISAEPRMNYFKSVAPEDSPNAYTPVAFYSQDTHYSIVKAMRVLAIPTFNEVGSGKFPCPLIYPDDYPANITLTGIVGRLKCHPITMVKFMYLLS